MVATLDRTCPKAVCRVRHGGTNFITQDYVFTQELLWMKDNPEIVISDSGTNIISTDFQELCWSKGISHNFSFKYHQQGKSQVESAVKTVKPILLAKLFRDKMSWCAALKATESA
eukprot:TRINITY_DN976_c0_g1_i8.p1 TRINITY_DN976_c0_g1~~TRINITY_DN976_c0_g1_i8.p1  ORF type:complete len:115 (-),score=9.36 TRINITY_DN976_c0_g1_i8:694-1038(-)